MNLRMLAILTILAANSALAAPWGVETRTVYDNLAIEELGLVADDSLASSGQDLWRNYCEYWNYGSHWGFECGTFQAYAGMPQESQMYPWLRAVRWDYRPDFSYACNGPNETPLGDNWCRVTNDPASNPFSHVPTLAQDYQCWEGPYRLCAGRAIANTRQSHPFYPGQWGSSSQHIFELDNFVIETISNNILIDFDPWSEANEIRPNGNAFITVEIQSTSVADGDAYDFDATTIDVGSLRLGPNNAHVDASPLLGDNDGDGDTDIIVGFRTQDTGVDCIPDSITISGTTMSGDPISGQDLVVPVDCEEPMLIDVDPYNDPNVVRPNDNYNLSLAILGMRQADGDGRNFYPNDYGQSWNGAIREGSIKIGPAEADINLGSNTTGDVDGDSNQDLIVGFNVFDAGIACGATELPVKAETNKGQPLLGFGTIETTACEEGCHSE